MRVPEDLTSTCCETQTLAPQKLCTGMHAGSLPPSLHERSFFGGAAVAEKGAQRVWRQLHLRQNLCTCPGQGHTWAFP